MFVTIIVVCALLFGGSVSASEPIYSLGFDYPLGETTRFVSQDGYYLTGGYEYKEKGFYGSCPTLYDEHGTPLNWNIFHPGTDVNSTECPRCDRGKPVYAVSSGIVTYAARSWGGQYNVKIKHVAPPGKAFHLADGGRVTTVYSLYAHMEKIKVNEGDVVYRGYPIGVIGDYPAGSNSNSHLHFEIRKTDISATTFCGASNEAFVDANYVDPYEFISLNRGINIESGMVFTYNLPKITPQIPLHALFTIRNYSGNWVTIENIVVALEPGNPETDTWDTVNPIDLEEDIDFTALAPYVVGNFFPSLVRAEYRKENINMWLPDGFYRVTPKIQVRIDGNSYWYNLPQGYANTRSQTQFSFGNSAENTSATMHITDLNIKQRTTDEYEATWTAPGKATVVANTVVTEPINSYEIRVDTVPLNPANFRQGMRISAPSPQDTGAKEELSFFATGSPIYMGIAENGNINKLSNIEFIAPDCTIPSAITGIQFGSVTDTSIELLWSQAPGLDYIEIWRRMDGEDVFQKRDTLTPAAHRYVDSGLNANTQYAYIVVPFNLCGAGPVDEVHFRSTEEFEPIPPTITYPDLVITDLQVPAVCNVDSENYSVFITVKNVGNADCENAALRVFQSATADLYDNAYHETTKYHLDFPTDEERTFEMLVETPPDPGTTTFHIGAWIDAKEDIQEADEFNNQLSKDVVYDAFEELTSFDCTTEEGGRVTCNWSEDFFESFQLWDAVSQSFLYTGTAHSYSKVLAPGNYSLYANGYDYPSNSYSPWRGPIEISIEAPEAETVLLLSSNGAHFKLTTTIPVPEESPSRILLSTTDSLGTTAIQVWVNEENHVVIQHTSLNSRVPISPPSILELLGHTVKDVQFLENWYGENYLVFFCLNNGYSRIITYQVSAQNHSKTTEIWKKSVYFFNFDRVTHYFISDFDGDGTTELSCWYRYPGTNNRTKLFRWESLSPFALDDPSAFYESYKINMDNVVDLIAGDFNGDNLTDLACFYDYNPGSPSKQSILVWESDGSRLQPFETWLTIGTYTFNFLGIDRIEHADVNGDLKDDLVILYEYADRKSIFVATSTATSRSTFSSANLFSPPIPWIKSLPKRQADIISPVFLDKNLYEDVIFWPFHN